MNTIFQTPTNNVKHSIAFYQTLDFHYQNIDGKHYVNDGKAVIEINSERTSRAGVKLYKPSWELEIQSLTQLNEVVKTESGYLLAAPSGVWVYLIESDNEPEINLIEPESSVLGNSMGLSIETISIEKSLNFWTLLGFAQSSGQPEQGWVSITNNEGSGISLMKPQMCPHLFFNPSLTYFNGENNLSVIQKIRDLNIPITEEITHFNDKGIVDNIIMRDPGGLGFFIFSD